MNRRTNILASTLALVASAAIAWWLIQYLGFSIVRANLKWVAGPATVLVSFAVGMIGKVHDVGELKGVTIEVIERLERMIKIIQLRLWLLIAVAVLTSLAGLFLSWIPDQTPPTMTVDIATWAVLATVMTATVFALIYLPWLQHDYTQFRLRVARETKERERRDELLKNLEQK